MLIRFIFGAVILTAFFVLAIPVLQIATFFTADNFQEIAQAEQAAQIEPAAGPENTNDEIGLQSAPSDDDLAAILNELEPAAGAEEVRDDGFGTYFRSEQPEGFTDQIETSENSELDL